MNRQARDWPSYIEAMAQLHDLSLDAERRAAVALNLAQIETLARRFMDFPLDAEVEIAPVFRP